MKRLLIAGLALFCVTAALPEKADAAKYVVYIHGRSMNFWPSAANLSVPSGWTHAPLSFNGSSRLTSTATAIKSHISTRCRGTNECVIICYSAGCARTLYALEQLRAAGTPADKTLWISAGASAAGGTKAAELATNKGITLLRKLFLTNPGESTQAIDYDLTRNRMRGTYGYMQNSAPVAMYHIAGSKNICIKTKIRGLSTVASAIGKWVGGLVAGPVGSVIGGILGSLFGSQKVKLCGNSLFPGKYGDGIVPVHSAAGYSNDLAHANHADGGPKYNLRAYEQVALFNVDHRGIFEPMVEKASLRMAINKNATCTNLPAEGSEGVASITYEDGDSSVTEHTPGELLMYCGASALSDPTEYSTCVGSMGCCDNFSAGATSGCTCGESLCIQSRWSTRSWFTGDKCSGTEYAEGANAAYQSWDGLGMIGTGVTSFTARSMRDTDGKCKALTRKATWSGGCPEYYKTTKSMSNMRRVYRPYISSYANDPAGEQLWPGYVVTTTNYSGYCP